VTTPDNAAVITSYAANTVTVTDQAGKARKSVSDGLGRLVAVYEDPNGLAYLTSYTYDTLDNLVKVTQDSQQRFFMYDSLKRLIRARNPEQGTHASLNLSDSITGNSAWSIGYQYDANNNLSQKTDARGVVSTYAYDAFGRNTIIDYSDTASINPDVKRFYDGATNGNGRFWYQYTGGDFSTGSNVEHAAVDSYDALGRPLVRRQLLKLNGTWSGTYQMSRAYNRAGGVTSQAYPSGHSVTYNYNSAGRLADKDALNPAFTGNLGDGVQRTYASASAHRLRYITNCNTTFADNCGTCASQPDLMSMVRGTEARSSSSTSPHTRMGPADQPTTATCSSPATIRRMKGALRWLSRTSSTRTTH
jgi:YD repeat-containing protein